MSSECEREECVCVSVRREGPQYGEEDAFKSSVLKRFHMHPRMSVCVCAYYQIYKYNIDVCQCACDLIAWLCACRVLFAALFSLGCCRANDRP